MISFYPGPSQIYAQIEELMHEAAESGILSVNHRSPEFVELSQQCQLGLRKKLALPSNFTIFYTSSATECWEIISESFIDQTSLHIYNGAFGEKWFQYRKKIMPNAFEMPFHFQKEISMNKVRRQPTPELVCVTQNETSNCTQVKNKHIKKLKKHFSDALICVDATSSMAGIELEWNYADIWFASVQKCFGLPAGMAIMVCSPRAIESALKAKHNQHYNSLVFMHEKMQDFQTTHTPNVLNIFLLKRMMELVEPIEIISKKIKARGKKIGKFFQDLGYRNLVENSSVRSDTVLGIKAKEDKLMQIKKAAKKEGFLLGNGYGAWKNSTFRIANFPALHDQNFEDLMEFFKNYQP